MPPFPTRASDILACPNPAHAKADWEIALSQGDDAGAIAAYVKLIRTGPSRVNAVHNVPALFGRWMNKPHVAQQGGHRSVPDEIIKNHYTGVYGIEHTFENGQIDWLFDPTATWGDQRTREWQVQFNRHYHWIALAQAWEETRDAKYAIAFENELRSWIAQCPRPDDNGMGLPGCWRLIEVGIRMGWTWPIALDTFRQCEHVSDEAIWLMITAMHEHGMHALLWPTKRNFKTMESNGLIQVGAMFPEFIRSFHFYSTALDRVCAELERQVYPDGSQDELAPSYALLSLANFFAAIKMAQQRPVTWAEIPMRALERLNDMAFALLTTATPDAMMPPIHDSPSRDITGLYNDFQQQTSDPRFTRKPWLEPGAFHLPWAGWVTLRREHQYALFDAGPWGTGHQHADAMQLLTHAHGRWFCIDSGKPLYDQSALTRHIKSAAGHNVVLMDGLNHQPVPKEPVATAPYPIAVYDGLKTNPNEHGSIMVAAAKRTAICINDSMKTTTSGFTHERVVIDMPQLGWIVLDRLNAQADQADQHDQRDQRDQRDEHDQPHAWESLWHLGTDELTLVNDDHSAWATYKDGPGMLIHPITALAHRPTLTALKGQTDPVHRGWEGHHNHSEHPAPCHVLSTHLPASKEPVTMVTLLLPVKNHTRPSVNVQAYQTDANGVHLELIVNSQSYVFDFQGRDEVTQMCYAMTGGSDAASGTISLSPHTK